MNWIKLPDLPETSVSGALLAGNVPHIRKELEEQFHLKITPLPKGKGLHTSLGWHTDILCHYAGEGKLFFVPSVQTSLHLPSDCELHPISREPKDGYPADILLNAARVGNRLFCREDYLAVELRSDCLLRDIRICSVRQGYSKCSVVTVTEQAIITADPSIAQCAMQEGLDVLRISPGYIALEGFSYGFLGGCVGRLAPDLMAFTGEIDRHPDGESIRAFLRNYGIFSVALQKGELQDIGGILPLTEIGIPSCTAENFVVK